MSKNTRVQNLTRGFSLRFNQACKAVELCSCVWVEHGVSIRDLTLAEAIAARNHQAAMRDPLPFAELPGLVYRPASGREGGARIEATTAIEANRFARAV